MNELRLGVDLGGTKIAITALDAEGQALYADQCPTPQGDYAATLDAIAELVNAAERDLGHRCTVGMGTPGSVSPLTGAMRNCNSTCLNGKFLKQDLETLLKRDIRIANDANCFALSEALDGAGAGFDCVFAVILGTGVGAGIVHNRQLLQGRNGIAGEWGHNEMSISATSSKSRSCYCGKENCIETWLSGPALVQSYGNAAKMHAQGSEPVSTVEEIVARQQEDEAVATDVLQVYSTDLAVALAGIVNVLDPDIIVLGGGLSEIPSLLDGLPGAIQDLVFSDQFTTPIVQATYGPASGVRGAACLFPA